jgi:hypothetical protein
MSDNLQDPVTGDGIMHDEEALPDIPAQTLAEIIRDISAHGCEHNWDIQAVQAAPEPTVRMPMAVVMPQTYVLVKCVHCGMPDVLTFPGEWTLKQMRADAFADERDELYSHLGQMSAAELTATLAPYRRTQFTPRAD